MEHNRSGTFSQAAGRLTQRLADQCENRATMAFLRKGLGREGNWHPQTAMVVGRALGDLDLHERDLSILYLVGGLFGLHPLPWTQSEDNTWSPSLLQQLNRLMEAEGRMTDDDRASVDRRVMALLNANQDDLADHLRHIMRRFRNSNIPVDWYQLSLDIKNWSKADRSVQRRWARDWWRAPRLLDVGSQELANPVE